MTTVNPDVQRPRRDLGNAWIWMLALAVPVLAALAIDGGDTAVTPVVFTAYATLAIGCVVVGIRVYRPAAIGPWVAIGPVALVLFLFGDLVWYVVSPSVAMVIYFTASGSYLIGLVLAAVTVRPDRGAIVDAALLSCAVLAIEWKLIVDAAHFSLGSASFLTLAIVVVYPVINPVAFAFTLILLFRAGTIRTTAAVLLVCAVGSNLLFDAIAGFYTARHQFDAALAWSGPNVLGWAAGGAMALHPSMRDLFARPSEHSDVRRSRWGITRFGLVAAAPIVPTVLLVWEAAKNGLQSPVLPLLTAAAIALSGVRLFDLITVLRRAALRDEALRKYADRLAAAEDRGQVLVAARSAARDLLGTDVRLVGAGSAAPDGAAAAVNLNNGERYELVAERPVSDDALTVIASGLGGALSRLSARERERAVADTLREQNARLAQLNEIKQSFVSMVSHELRTPLTSIVGYLEFLREGEGGELTDEQARFVSVIERNADRLQQLVDDILQLGRADEGRIKLTVEPVDGARLVRRAAESAGPAAEHKGLTLTVEVAPELPELAGDRRLLAQALDNLVSNAIKFTPPGGTVTIRARPAGEGVELEVQDSGVGIPADELPRLFERFFRASTAVASGTGLGLTIAQSIADLHGGTISVDSTVGVGSTFRLRLPLAPPPTHQPRETETLQA